MHAYRELLAALRLLREGHVQQGFLGSEAGAVGMCQFMPSNYFQFALQDTEAGPRDRTSADIWGSPEDTLASIANFLLAHGYQKGDGYGTLAVLLSSGDLAEVLQPRGSR
jgi:membrane-bound lytic murein transglycosylase B